MFGTQLSTLPNNLIAPILKMEQVLIWQWETLMIGYHGDINLVQGWIDLNNLDLKLSKFLNWLEPLSSKSEL